MANDTQPIIIKKIKKGGHGHHGGAWKVAFADFVTAMMAFFMLMWLLGSTTPEQKAAISDYFNNPSAIPGPGGASTSIIKHGGEMDIPTGEGPNPLQHNVAVPEEQQQVEGDMSTGKAPEGEQDAGKATIDEIDEKDAEQIAKEKEKERMMELLDALKKVIDASENLARFKDQLLIDMTNEGLRIQIIDKENRAMFAKGSNQLESYAGEILREIATVIKEVPNKVSISGHTDRTPYISRGGNYSNWELSADRANSARREVIAGGMPEEKIGRVVGLADSVLFDKTDAFNPVNRRISIIVMNKATEEAISQGEGMNEPAPESTHPLEPSAAPFEAPPSAAPAPTDVAPTQDTAPLSEATAAPAGGAPPAPPTEPAAPDTAEPAAPAH